MPTRGRRRPGGSTAESPRPRRKTLRPHLVRRGRAVYVSGCTVPVWRLEMARRAGSDAAALADAFPGLTPRGLRLAFAYARLRRRCFDRLIRRHGPAVVAPAAEPDEGDEFGRDLSALLERDAALYRRLAR